MTANFVTFYLIIVLITGPFFQYLPVPESLKWDEILLAKILNQAPVLFLFGYLIKEVKKVQKLNIYLLLIGFLFTCVFSESYYYFTHPDNLFIVIVINNIISYVLLSCVFYKKISNIKSIQPAIMYYAIAGAAIITICFSFSAYEIFKYYFIEKTPIFLVLIAFILTAILIVFLSFLIDNPFKKAWYEIIIGVVFIVTLDVYTYSCMFVFNTQPKLLFTFGRILLSIGLLLIVDGVLRKNFNEKSLQ